MVRKIEEKIKRYKHGKLILRFLKVCVIGTIGAIIQIFIYFVLKSIFDTSNIVTIFAIGLINTKTIFNLIAAEFSIISNFILNNKWSFWDRKLRKAKIVVIKFLQFNVFSFGSLIIQAVVIEVGTRANIADSNIYDLFLIVTGILIGLIYQFSIYNLVIWRKNK